MKRGHILPIMKYSLHFKCRKSFLENGRFEEISFILGCQRAACNQQTMQISRFINHFDDCKKVCSPNMWVRWQHSCSNAGLIMIDNLLRTSPEMVTWARKGHFWPAVYTVKVWERFTKFMMPIALFYICSSQLFMSWAWYDFLHWEMWTPLEGDRMISLAMDMDLNVKFTMIKSKSPSLYIYITQRNT